MHDHTSNLDHLEFLRDRHDEKNQEAVSSQGLNFNIFHRRGLGESAPKAEEDDD